jgi:long-subunit fatty acid transport protein
MKEIPLLIGFIFISTHVNAQKEYDLLGKGARAAGMAYAFTAIADDATAISWNPAGIVQIKKPELAFVNSLTATKRGSDELDYKPVYMVDYLGFVYPLKMKMKDLAFGFSLQNKMNYKYNYASIPSELSRNEGNSSLTVNAITLCGAYSINRFIAAGFSYNQWFSLGNREYTYDEYNYVDATNTYEFSKNFKYNGNNFTAGVLLDFASLHFPLRFALKYENRFILKRNHDEIRKLNHIYTYYEDTSWTYTYNGIEKYYIPRILTTGISYRFGDYLIFSCDLEIRLFSGRYYGWNYRWIENLTANDQTTLLKDTVYLGEITWDKFYSKLNQYRFGVEYILHPKSALIPIRAGWKNNPTSLYDYDEKYSLPKQVYAHSINLGTGFVTKRFSVDLAYEQYKYERTDEYNKQVEKKLSFFILSAILYLK